MESSQPSQTEMSQAWRKRPAHLLKSSALRPAKRLKQVSSTSSRQSTSNDRQPRVGASGELIGDPSRRVRAEQWFDDTNEHPKAVSFVDDDPPYYMKNASSDYNSVCATQSENSAQDISKIGPTAPTRSLLAQMDADIDNGDAYRSVIDDLTVQNQKLKKKLKKYEVLHCSHLQEEKLFEVRIHGLAADRKRELEETLQSFASSIDEDSPRQLHPLAPASKAPLLHKTTSSTTSASKPAQDSAYASMSGQTGIASLSHLGDPHFRQLSSKVSRQAVKSYLHDMPAALAPEPSVTMSDRSKSKAIVWRLEQLFTGRGAASRQYGQSQQQQQQQEVSQSAALASGHGLGQEGTREAHILSHDAELQVDAMEDVRTQTGHSEFNPQRLQASQGASSQKPEQRPTRPLDLDLHRAQVPSDNMEYIRHLGLSSTSECPTKDPESKDGWVYLNLLTSMAQLHTLNVTPEFIRKAVADCSLNFELSPDQTKIRWIAGGMGTIMSSDGDESEDQVLRNANLGPTSKDEVRERTVAPAYRSTDSSTVPEVGAKRRPIHFKGAKDEDNSLHYKPLFFHTAVSEDDGSEFPSVSLSSSESPYMATATGSHSSVTALRDRVSRFRGPRRNDGPMIFYNRAKFCTDLSGDVNGTKRKHSTYRCLTKWPIGSSDPPSSEVDGGDSDVNLSKVPDPASFNGRSSNIRSSLNFDDLKSVLSDYASDSNSSSNFMGMEASGLGGIRPGDNFAVKVQIRHQGKHTARRNISSFSKPSRHVRKVLHTIPRSSVDAFRSVIDLTRNQEIEQQVTSEIISSVKTEMPPSALPPPSYVHLPFTSSSGSDSDNEETSDDSAISSAHAKNAYRNWPNHTTQFGGKRVARNSENGSNPEGKGFDYESTTSPSNESDMYSDSSSSTIDLLAHARGLDPETIAAREREFESNRGEQIAEVQVKTLAATVGGVGGGHLNGELAEGDAGSDVDSMSVDGDTSSDDQGRSS